MSWFSSREHIANFINGETFVREEKALKDVENTTKVGAQIRITQTDSVAANAAFHRDRLTQSTVPTLPKVDARSINGVGRSAKKARGELALTQEQCADIIGISTGTLQNAELKNSKPNRETYLRIYGFLELAKLLKLHVKQKFLLRTLLHTKMGAFGNRTAVEYIKLLPEDSRVNELRSVFSKIYE